MHVCFFLLSGGGRQMLMPSQGLGLRVQSTLAPHYLTVEPPSATKNEAVENYYLLGSLRRRSCHL